MSGRPLPGFGGIEEDGVGDPGFDLALRCREGDPAAWSELYLAHGRRVASFLRRLLGNTPDLEDLVQQVFVNLLSSLPNFRGDARFGTFVLGVATHVADTHLRREFRWRRRKVAYRLWTDAGPSLGYDPAAGAQAREILAVTFGALGQMDLGHRAVWTLSDVEGLDSEEVSRALAIPAGTVRSRLFHARRRVATALVEAGFEVPGPRASGPGTAGRGE
jgi:RNA polymerase sigma-70 factor (ECF subfamily)